MATLSPYCAFIPVEEGIALYNYAGQTVIDLVPELVSLIMANKETIEEIKQIHPDLYTALNSGNFIENYPNEIYDQLINKMILEFSSAESFQLTVNPTLACNCNCWYCYENHDNMPLMDENHLSAIKQFISRKLNSSLNHFHLDFFGGEPLLGFDSIVKPIIEHLKYESKVFSKTYSIGFTTNGTLLDESRIQYLISGGTNQPVRFQITLDGSRNAHNATRSTRDGRGTYDLIIQNIKSLLQNGASVMVRFNYTTQNAYTFIDVASEFDDLTVDERKRLLFSFHKVWQSLAKETTNEIIHSMEKTYKSWNYNVEDRIIYKGGHCYADKENCIVINYNGDVFKCTARDFDNKKRIGTLTSDGQIIYNKLYSDVLSYRFGTQECKTCRLFPICHGNCSQFSYENRFTEGCVLHYSEEDKQSIILKYYNAFCNALKPPLS